VVADMLKGDELFELPLLLRLLLRTPVLRDVPARLIAYGAWPVHPKESRRARSSASMHKEADRRGRSVCYNFRE
jgi:hypothetical protein